MTNYEMLIKADPYELKRWYCDGHICGTCKYNISGKCTIHTWLASEYEPPEPEWTSTPIDAIMLPPRAYRQLYKSGVWTLGELYKNYRKYDIEHMTGVGKKTAKQIELCFEQAAGIPLRN